MSRSWTKEELEAASKEMKAEGHLSYEEFCETVKVQSKTTNKYWIFLEELRQSGVTNMFGAGPYLQEEFGLTKKEAHEILADWMKNYNPDDY